MSDFLFSLGSTGEELRRRAEKEALFAPGLAALEAIRPGKLSMLFRQRFESDGGCQAPPLEAFVPAVAEHVHDMLGELIDALGHRGDDASDLSRLRGRLTVEAKMGNFRGAEVVIRDCVLAVADVIDDFAADDDDFSCPHETRDGGLTAVRSWAAYARRVSGKGDAMVRVKELSEMVDRLAARMVPSSEVAEGAGVPAASPVLAAAPAAAEAETVEHILRRRPRRKAEAADKKDS